MAIFAAAALATESLAADGENTATLTDQSILKSQKLPEPLTTADAARYRQIFDIQQDGHWKQADAVIERLENRILLGHVLAQRYLHPNRYRSRYGELAAWMKEYADHPDAKRIYELAIRRKPRRLQMPTRPELPKRETFTESGDGGIEHVNRSSLRYSNAARQLHASIRRLVRQERLTAAETLAGSPAMRALGKIHQGIAEARIAAGWFYYGEDEKAYELGSRAARKAGNEAPFGHWYAGLAAFRLGRYEAASDQFQAMAAIGGQSRWPRSAAAFWAARSGLRAGRPDEMARWLRLAASYPRTF